MNTNSATNFIDIASVSQYLKDLMLIRQDILVLDSIGLYDHFLQLDENYTCRKSKKNFAKSIHMLNPRKYEDDGKKLAW